MQIDARRGDVLRRAGDGRCVEPSGERTIAQVDRPRRCGRGPVHFEGIVIDPDDIRKPSQIRGTGDQAGILEPDEEPLSLCRPGCQDGEQQSRAQDGGNPLRHGEAASDGLPLCVR